MKYQKLNCLLEQFVSEKKLNQSEAKEVQREVERILDRTIQKAREDEGKK